MKTDVSAKQIKLNSQKEPPMTQILSLKKIAAVSAVLAGIFSSPLAFAVTVETEFAGQDCGAAKTTLNSAEATYLNAQMQLNQAQLRCKGDFSCIYPYQSAFAEAQTRLTMAQTAVNSACK